eukprot:scaffold1672_cov366-Prasinococcus_capsulatus_cf.AAC.5
MSDSDSDDLFDYGKRSKTNRDAIELDLSDDDDAPAQDSDVDIAAKGRPGKLGSVAGYKRKSEWRDRNEPTLTRGTWYAQAQPLVAALILLTRLAASQQGAQGIRADTKEDNSTGNGDETQAQIEAKRRASELLQAPLEVHHASPALTKHATPSSKDLELRAKLSETRQAILRLAQPLQLADDSEDEAEVIETMEAPTEAEPDRGAEIRLFVQSKNSKVEYTICQREEMSVLIAQVEASRPPGAPAPILSLDGDQIRPNQTCEDLGLDNEEIVELLN